MRAEQAIYLHGGVYVVGPLLTVILSVGTGVLTGVGTCTTPISFDTNICIFIMT